MIRKVLVANRGEIAIRIARTARRMGIVTYAIRTRKEPEAVYLSSVDIQRPIRMRFMRSSQMRQSVSDRQSLARATCQWSVS